MDEGETAAWGFVHDNAEYRRGYSFLKFSQPLGYKLTLDLDGYVTNRDDHAKYGGRNDQGAITFSSDLNDWDINRGANSRLTWGDGQQNLVTGIEYAHTHARSTDLLSGNPPTADLTWERWSLYGNGAYSIGPVTILPGIRYDHTGLAGNNSSYMLGATWQLTEKTTLRGYVGNGYSPTSTSHLNGLQKVTTVQGGVESGAVPYIWLKATYFNNLLRNSQTIGVVPLISNQRREGFEIEARTTPFFGFALNSGYTYLYAKSTDTGARLQTDSSQTVPPHTVKLALNYDNSTRGLRGALTGNYVWWNASTDSMAQGDGMIWNLHLNWKVCPKSALSPELFFSGHNLFNGVQTTDTELFTNAGRWFEGGIRVNF
jgi:vitamin B12 transporter